MARVTPGFHTPKSAQDPKKESFIAAVAVMRRNLGDVGFDLPACAKELYMSERSLQRVFSKQNTTFRDTLMKLRMKHAKKLLLETRLPISEVAARVGYRQAMHFAKAYKRATGQSPSKLRKQAGLPARIVQPRA